MAKVTNSISLSGSGGSSIIVVANYSALPDPTTVSGEFYWVSNSQGTKWLPGSLGGTYYNSGLYYSNGTTWEFMNVPYQATQLEVDTGTNTDKFVTPSTLSNSTWAFTTAKTLATLLTGISFATGGAIVSTDTVLIAFGKIQKQINDLSTVYQAILTDINFGAFSNSLSDKTTPVDADTVNLSDSADSNKAKKTTWINVWTNYLKPKADAIYAPNGSIIKSIVADYVTSAGVTATTTETLVASYKINANTFQASDFFNLMCRVIKTGTAGVYSVYIRIGTTATFSTSLTQIAMYGYTTLGALDVNIQRYFKIEDGFLKGSNFTIAMLNNQGVQVAYSESTEAFNTTVDNWIFISIKPQSNNADVMYKSIFKITN